MFSYIVFLFRSENENKKMKIEVWIRGKFLPIKILYKICRYCACLISYTCLFSLDILKSSYNRKHYFFLFLRIIYSNASSEYAWKFNFLIFVLDRSHYYYFFLYTIIIFVFLQDAKTIQSEIYKFDITYSSNNWYCSFTTLFSYEKSWTICIINSDCCFRIY